MAIKALFLSFLFVSVSCFSAEPTQIRFDQKTGAELPQDVSVIDEQGQSIPFSSVLGEKPIILSYVYYGCPNLCTLVLNGLADATRTVGLQAGRDFKLVTLSIDPKETPSLALAKKRSYLARIGQTGDRNPSWRFLTASEDSIQKLTQASGFYFKYDPLSEEYNHPSGIIILTPGGLISRYLFGIRFDPKELKSALAEASLGKSRRTLTEVILNCFHYDPQNGKYGYLIVSLLQWISALTVIGLGFLFFKLCLPKKVVHD